MTIAQLEEWFKKTELPKAPVQLMPGTTILNVEHFLESHFAPLKIAPYAKVNEPLLWRLQAF